MVSAGFFTGLGGSFGVSYTNEPLTSDTGKSTYAEIDAGFDESGGTIFSITDNGIIGGAGGSGPTKAIHGIGFGDMGYFSICMDGYRASSVGIG